MSIIEKDNEFVINSYKRQPVELMSGSGVVATDINGKEYIDFGSGIGVNSLGYCDPDWTRAINDQATKLQHTSNLYATKPQAELAQKLCEKTGYKKVFFANSGAEANEGAIKIARKYSFDKYGIEAQRNVIITLVNSFHGRTITTLAATGQDSFHQNFFPFTKGFRYANMGNIEEFKALIDQTVCAVMIEPIQGEGGVTPLNWEYLRTIRSICENNDILLIADEIQTGVGRTGYFLASESYDIKPNIVTLAKGLGGGLPIGAILTDEITQSVLKFSDHGSTFGGNPVVCAGANVVVDKIYNSDFLAKVKEKGKYITTQLEGIEEIDSVSGLGMMIGVKLKTKLVADVVTACLANGLLVLSAKEKLRLLPPLVISYDEINKGLDILKKVLTQ